MLHTSAAHHYAPHLLLVKYSETSESDEMYRVIGMVSILGMVGCGRNGFEIMDGALASDDLCFGSVIRTCLTSRPTMDLRIDTPTTINTSADAGPPSLCDPDAADADRYCVVAARNLTVASALSAYGKRPLVLLAAERMDVQGAGSIDVSGSVSAPAPAVPSAPGAEPPECGTGQAPEPSGGGHGGSFHGRGGAGKAGSSLPDRPSTAPAGIADLPSYLRGGCAGHRGGGDADLPGGPGPGGGALALIASELNLAGRINASGGPGLLGMASPSRGQGGGGGGAGGMIVVDARTISSAGCLLFANGGGGGGGGSLGAGGANGTASTGVDPAEVGRGGSVPADLRNGDGADGSSITSIDGQDATNSVANAFNGGGGGGGGAGFIYAPTIDPARVSPPSSPAQAAAQISRTR